MAAHLATPLVCWLLNSFVLKRRIHWQRLFFQACVVGYLFLMLVVASRVVNDALARQNIDASAVFGEGESSDAALALAPMLGIPVTLFWTAVNFIAFSVIEWCFRTDFRSILGGNVQADHAVELEPSNATAEQVTDLPRHLNNRLD